MKKLIIAGAIALLSTAPSFAQSQAGSHSQSGAQAGVHIGGSALQAPSAIGPGLTASGLSCAGSTSIGGSGAGWGLSFGFTKSDKHCDAREDAKYMQAITGSTRAAKARLCMVKDNRDAFAIAGDPCPQDLMRTASRQVNTASHTPRTARTFKSMAECQKFAASNSGYACRAR